MEDLVNQSFHPNQRIKTAIQIPNHHPFFATSSHFPPPYSSLLQHFLAYQITSPKFIAQKFRFDHSTTSTIHFQPTDTYFTPLNTIVPCDSRDSSFNNSFFPPSLPPSFMVKYPRRVWKDDVACRFALETRNPRLEKQHLYTTLYFTQPVTGVGNQSCALIYAKPSGARRGGGE